MVICFLSNLVERKPLAVIGSAGGSLFAWWDFSVYGVYTEKYVIECQT